MPNNTYDSKGGYTGYNRNNADREAHDFYATAPWEVTNFINLIGLTDYVNDNNKNILEPSAGNGAMIRGMLDAGIKENLITATDLIDYQNKIETRVDIKAGDEYNFLKDTYPVTECDIIIMNPPFKNNYEFITKALTIAKEKVIVFNRVQLLEGIKRYEALYENCQLTDVYVYVNRVNCYTSGEIDLNAAASPQCYAWFVWDKTIQKDYPSLHWIKRIEKKDIHFS